MNVILLCLLVMACLALGIYVISALRCLFTFGWSNAALAFSSPLADAADLLRREDLAPKHADGFLFHTAPLIAFTAVSLAALCIPAAYGLIAFDPSIGVFYFLTVLGPFVVAMMNAGWSQNSHEGVFASFRAAAHLISYEVPIGFAAIGPVMAASSLSTTRIVEGQHGLWYIVWQPISFLIYIAAALFMSYRRPFDTPQAGTELEAGVLGEYSGPRLLIFKAALDGILLLLCALGAVLFLGGWQGPALPGAFWFGIKTFALGAMILWLGHRLPRLRHDQMLSFCWKVLLPVSLVNIAIVGILILVLPDFRS